MLIKIRKIRAKTDIFKARQALQNKQKKAIVTAC